VAAPLSPYDDTVPHPAPDPALAGRFTALRTVRQGVDLDHVRDVVLLVSSSRGGSSMLAEILRRVDGVLSLPGEVNPHVVIAQLAGGDADVFRAELARDVGAPAPDAIDHDGLVNDVHWRLTTQWPTIELDPAEVRRWVGSAREGTDPVNVDAFTRAVLEEVHRAEPAVVPAAYDLSGHRGEPPLPTEPVVEMTPYVGFRPWRTATDVELHTKPLVLATPRNSYRLDWLVGLFPAARVRVLHLTRNPAASVNGLIDGWRSPSFFTTRVEVDLAATGDRWWKYDVPPGWRELTSASLPQVAATQWRSAHAAVLDFAGGRDIDVLRLRYEDLVGDRARREQTGHALAGFLGIDVAAMRAAVLAGVPPVMATAPPQRRRWSASDNDLAPALAEPAVWDVAAALGYEVEERLWI
jgi:hypothetical protein